LPCKSSADTKGSHGVNMTYGMFSAHEGESHMFEGVTLGYRLRIMNRRSA
jgi:hypothetical protein